MSQNNWFDLKVPQDCYLELMAQLYHSSSHCKHAIKQVCDMVSKQFQQAGLQHLANAESSSPMVARSSKCCSRWWKGLGGQNKGEKGFQGGEQVGSGLGRVTVGR